MLLLGAGGLLAGCVATRAPTAPALLAVALALGAAARAAETMSYDAAPLRAVVARDESEPLQLEGVVRGDPRPAGAGSALLLDVEAARLHGRALPAGGRARVQIAANADSLHARDGDRVRLWATLDPPRRFRTPGAFDAEAQARREGVHALGWCKSVALLEVMGRDAGTLRVLASRVRAWARRRLTAALPAGEELALARAMLLGDRTGMSPETGEAFRRAGTYHVLAISGAQVAIVVALLAWLGRRGGLAPGTVAVAVTAATVFYAALVGGDIPVVRASIAAVVVIWGRALDLDADLANLLGLAAAVLLLWQPSSIGDAGFQLSFAATMAIVCWTAPLAARMPAMPLRLELALASSLCAQAALLPLLLLHFHRAAPAALLLNLVAVPLSTAVLFAAAAVVAAPPVPLLPHACASLAWWTAHLLLASSDPAGLASRLDVRLPDPPLLAVLLFVGAAIAVGRGVRRALPLAGAGLVLMLARSDPQGDGRLEICLLDVGQGDGIVVRTPAGRYAVVDAGGARGGTFDVGEAIVAPFLWRRGVRRLDVLLVTHAHPDHAGGVPALARAFGPAQVWEGLAPLADPGYERFAAAIAPLQLARRAVARGTRARWDGVDVEVVGPAAGHGPPWTVKNDHSVVLRLGLGRVRFLLAGDMESAAEAALGGIRADVVKVAHHGSRTSSSASFVDGSGATLAIVSAGRRNTFGHPHPEVTRRWAAAGTRMLRTDLEGTLSVSTDGERIWVRTFEQPQERRIR